MNFAFFLVVKVISFGFPRIPHKEALIGFGVELI